MFFVMPPSGSTRRAVGLGVLSSLTPPFLDRQLPGPGALIFAVVHLLNLASDSDTLLFKHLDLNVFVTNNALHFPWIFLFL